VRAAQEDLDFGSRSGRQEEREDEGELIESAEGVSFILVAPGYSLREFKVGVTNAKLRVSAPDFELARPVHCKVDPSSQETGYNNGVLSVRLAKSV
jgi:HSP20 family molecular chaperone IbpA